VQISEGSMMLLCLFLFIFLSYWLAYGSFVMYIIWAIENISLASLIVLSIPFFHYSQKEMKQKSDGKLDTHKKKANNTPQTEQ
jgi:hypothetical protein